MSRPLSTVEALREAMVIAMETDPRVILLGQDVVGGGRSSTGGVEVGGVMGVSRGLADRFGRERVVDTPISEMGVLGAAVGAAVTGMRPVVELMFNDFVGVCLDPLLNQAAKFRYMFGGRSGVPLTVRTMTGAGGQGAAQHSQSLYGIFAGIPGLRTVIPATPADAKGLLLSAIRCPDPVIFCEPRRVLPLVGEVPEGDWEVPLGLARQARAGGDVTIVAMGATVATALEAAEILAARGVQAEVLDLRSLEPLDETAILGSLEVTGRLVVVDEATPRCGIASDVAALCAERGFDHLRRPVRRVTAPFCPVPFSRPLEEAYLPDAARVVEAVASLF